jgi:hypothetical protein
MPDVYLYAGETLPADVCLADPTVLRGAVTFTGALAATQIVAALAASGSLDLTGAGAMGQAIARLDAMGGQAVLPGFGLTNWRGSGWAGHARAALPSDGALR